MRIMKTLLVMAVAAITNLLPAQDYAADISKAITVFASPKLQVNAEINVYPFYASKEVSHQYKAELKKDGDKFYSVMEGTRMLLNDKYMVMVYDADKRVICTERDRKSKKTANGGDPSAQLDSLLKNNDSIVYLGIVNHAKQYTIYTGKSLIRRTEIHLDETTGYIKMLVYYYNEKLVPSGNKVRVNYTINTTPVFSANEFSERRFVIFGRGDAITPGSECANYFVTYIDPETSVPTEK